MKTLRIALIVLMVLSVSSCKFFKQQRWFSKDVDTLLTLDEPYIEPIDTLQIETIVQETEPIKSPIASGETTYGYGSDKFYMVVGSFLSEQLAGKYAKKIQELGYQPQIIYSNSAGFYRVSAKSYNDFTTAVNDISNFRDNVTPRAWVHVRKK